MLLLAPPSGLVAASEVFMLAVEEVGLDVGVLVVALVATLYPQAVRTSASIANTLKSNTDFK